MSRYKKSKIPNQSRTIPLKGDRFRGARSAGSTGEDFRKYYRCWHCGFTCDVERDTLGGITSGDGREVVEFVIPLLKGAVYLGTGALVIGSNTVTRTPDVKSNFKPDVGSGCPFCGSLNWKGEYF